MGWMMIASKAIHGVLSKKFWIFSHSGSGQEIKGRKQSREGWECVLATFTNYKAIRLQVLKYWRWVLKREKEKSKQRWKNLGIWKNWRLGIEKRWVAEGKGVEI